MPRRDGDSLVRMVEWQKPAEETTRNKEYQVQDGDSHGGEVFSSVDLSGNSTNDGDQHVHNQ